MAMAVRSSLDQFRHALAGATRAIARDAEADVMFGSEGGAPSGKTARVASPGPPLELPPVACPTMGVWSSRDYALTESQMTASADQVTGPWRYERIESVSHDVPVSAPDQLNALLLDFLA